MRANEPIEVREPHAIPEEPPEAAEGDGSAQRASGTALSDLYAQHGSVLLTYLVGMTRGDRHRAEDILQETLVRAWKHPEARSETGQWSRPWLYTVARRIAIDHIRASMIRPIESSNARLGERPEVDDWIERLVDRELVRDALDALPERFRTVLIEVYLHERTAAEAAELLGVPVGTIKSRTFYALRALREELVQRDYFKAESG